MTSITTHVLDTASGTPAVGVPVQLWSLVGGDWRQVGSGTTDADGRVPALLGADEPVFTGEYRLMFDTATYFAAIGVGEHFFPRVTVDFSVADTSRHHHVPVLLSPYGYTTYRGS
jgi:5-hydroxyisourate hydrolase